MKKLAQGFPREIVAQFLDGTSRVASGNFELMAALMMQRLYERQWDRPVLIGYYMTEKYQHLLTGKYSSPDLWLDALANGVDENDPIDFILLAADETSMQEFQLKRFGMNDDEPQDTDALIQWLNSMKNRYARIDAACLVALKHFERIDFQKVAAQVEKSDFPFTELLLFGVVNDKFLIAGILPEQGWSSFRLSEVVN
jgi:hypothetical protein